MKNHKCPANNILIYFTYYIVIILLSFIPVVILINIEFENQVYILENILKMEIGAGGYGVFYLFYFTYSISFIVNSIIIFIIYNKLTKYRSNIKMLLITLIYIIIHILLTYILKYLLFSIYIFLPFIQLLLSKKKKNEYN